MAAAAIIAAKKVRAEALAREARMTDEDIIKMIEDRKREEEEDKIVHRQPAQDPNNFCMLGWHSDARSQQSLHAGLA